MAVPDLPPREPYSPRIRLQPQGLFAVSTDTVSIPCPTVEREAATSVGKLRVEGSGEVCLGTPLFRGRHKRLDGIFEGRYGEDCRSRRRLLRQHGKAAKALCFSKRVTDSPAHYSQSSLRVPVQSPLLLRLRTCLRTMPVVIGCPVRK